MGILILGCQFHHQYRLTYISKVTHTYTIYRLMFRQLRMVPLAYVLVKII
jgi:hypothetical protein